MQTETCNTARFLPIRLVARTDRNIRAKGQHGFLTFSMLSFFICAYVENAHRPIHKNAHIPIRHHTHDAHAPIRHEPRTALYTDAHRLIQKIARPLIHKMHTALYIIAR